MDWSRLDALLAAGDHAGALELAVAAWRSRKCAPYANLVDAIAAKLPRAKRTPKPPVVVDEPLGARFRREGRVPSPAEMAQLMAERRAARSAPPADDWTARVAGASAAELGPLLATLDRAPEVGNAYLDPVKRRHVAWFRRLGALAARPADPRIASALVAALRDARLTVIQESEAEVVYAPAIELLVELADERAIDSLESLLAHPVAKRASVREFLASALPPAIAQLAPSPPLLPADAARCASLVETEPPPPPPRIVDDGALLDGILAKPDDDGPRAVLADVWIERGDPRGELISLQLRGGKPDRGLLRRVDATLGDLARVTKNRVYARGFLDRIELQNNAAADPKVWAAAAASPLLATVREVGKGQANETLYRAFITSPHARSLARIFSVSKAMLADLCERGSPVRELELGHAVDAALLRRVATAPLPNLALLGFTIKPAPLDKLAGKRKSWFTYRFGRVEIRGDVCALLREHLPGQGP